MDAEGWVSGGLRLAVADVAAHTADNHRDYPVTIVNTGSCVAVRTCPHLTGSSIGGNHRSQCAISPAT